MPQARQEALLQRIHALVEEGHYRIGPHVEWHMMEEGFDKEHCVGAVLGGRLLESYPTQNRHLVAGRFHLSERNTCPLHVVCEIGVDNGEPLPQPESFFALEPDPTAPLPPAPPPPNAGVKGKPTARQAQKPEREQSVVRFITAYIPRPPDWISPHVRAQRPGARYSR